MDCSDLILLHRLLDGELEEAQAELVAHHIESCSVCRAATKDAAELRAFVQDRLGVEDEGEEDAAAAALAGISRRLPVPDASRARSSRWSPRTWLVSAAAIALVLLLPLAFVPAVGAWPAQLLEEAATRERMWMYKPNRVLHWEVETVSKGIRSQADGRWRTLFWQNNGATTFRQMSRQFDPQGRTEHAYWQQADGATTNYRSKAGNVMEISPSTAVAREALPTLDPELRAALQSYLARRQRMRTLDVSSRRAADWFHRPSVWASGGTVTLRRGLLDRWGEVHHLTVMKEGSQWNPMVARVVHEYDIQSSTFRLLRLKTTLTYRDGTAGVHDSRWIYFQETSAAEFDAQTPRDLLESGMPVVRLTPVEVARRHLQEMNAAAN